MTEDVLERAKAADIDVMAITDWGQLRDLFGGLITEVERLRAGLAHELDLRNRHIESLEARIKELQDLIDKPPEEADWVADYHLLQSALDGPIIDAARKWHAAYRKAQNSNLMRAKEIERLRSENKIISDRAAHHEKQDAAEIELLAARIKEMEEANRNIDKRRDEMAAFIERLEAAFLEAKRCPTYNGAGKLIDVVISRNLGRVESERVCPLCEGKWEEKAREALERIKAGGKDEN